MKSVLIVDDEPGTDSFFQRGLTSRFDVIETAGDTATAMLERCHFDLILADIRLPDHICSRTNFPASVAWSEAASRGEFTAFLARHAQSPRVGMS